MGDESGDEDAAFSADHREWIDRGLRAGRGTASVKSGPAFAGPAGPPPTPL